MLMASVSPKQQVLWGVLSMHWLILIKKIGAKKDNWHKGHRPQGSLMRMGSEGQSIWSNPAEAQIAES